MQKLRKEISNDFKWDLDVVYSNIDEFNADLLKVDNLLSNFNEYKNCIMDSASNLYNCLCLENNISRILDRLYTYAHCNFDADTSNTIYQDLVGKVENMYQKFNEVTAFVSPSILKYDYSKIETFYDIEPRLKEFEIGLKETFRFKKHTLSEAEEKIISGFEKSLEYSSKIYDALVDTDLVHGNFIDENGNTIELTDSNYNKYIKSNNRKVREDVFKLLHKTYSNFQNTISKTLAGNVESVSSIAKVRKYNSAIEASLIEDNINIEVYNNLIDTVSNNLEPLFKYYELKRNLLNLNEFHLYDTYVSVVNEKPRDYTFEEAKSMVIDALSVLGDNYINDLKQSFSQKWIDVYNNKGKRGGAYSGGSYDTYPYVLLNFEGTLNDVSTLAHELGHSMHSYYSRKNNSYQNSSYKIFVAEVASTVNELLLAKYMLKSTNDKKEKLIILNNLLDLFKATIYRQTMFAEFERDIYAMQENGTILTAEVLNNHYYNLNKKYFGENVFVDEEIKYEWERIPHFYYNFYVYKYATGLSAACYIVDGILNNRENALNNYLKFLSLGGSMEPLEELKVAGVDMSKPEVIISAIKMFEEILNEFSELCKN